MLEDFFKRQLAVWPEVQRRYDELKDVEIKALTGSELGDVALAAQWNPARIVSTGAKIDRKSLAERPCFLCAKNRPKEQFALDVEGEFELLVNPFPILPMHFTVPALRHRPQTIRESYGELWRLLERFPRFMFFYNGPKCGASAPDHAHFQGGTSGVVPLQKEWPKLSQRLTEVHSTIGGTLSRLDGWPCKAWVIESSTAVADESLFGWLYEQMPMGADDTEPMMNIVAWRTEDRQLCVIFPRAKHRPNGYPEPMISPGALDMAGLMITPRRDDFDWIDSRRAAHILAECGTEND